MRKRTRLYLVRHGESELNKQARLAGQLDTALTETGIEQAHQAKQELASVLFDTVYSSDLQRAFQTAAIIYGQPVTRQNRLPGLRERTFGEFQGQPRDILSASEAVKNHLPDAEKWTFKNTPGMESDQELEERFMESLRQIAVANTGKTILVVAHGGPIRTTLMKTAHFTHNDLPGGSFKNAGYVELSYDGRNFKVIQINGKKL